MSTGIQVWAIKQDLKAFLKSAMSEYLRKKNLAEILRSILLHKRGHACQLPPMAEHYTTMI